MLRKTKTERRVGSVFWFLIVMLLLSFISEIIREQQKPIVLAQACRMDELLPVDCLYDIRFDDKKASIFVLEETGVKRDPFLVRQREVTIEAEYPEGYAVSGSGLYGAQKLIVYTNRSLTDSQVVQVKQKKELIKNGRLVFLEKQGNENRYIEEKFTGIPEKVILERRVYYGLTEETWQAYVFYDNPEELPQRICKWFWCCILFWCVSLFFLWEMKRFLLECKRKMEFCYVSQFLEQELAFILTHMIIWVLVLFVLIYLAMEIGATDYGVLAQWLPDYRAVDISHYRSLYREWKTGMLLYLEKLPLGNEAEAVKRNLEAWKNCLWQGVLATDIGIVAFLLRNGVCYLFFRKVRMKKLLIAVLCMFTFTFCAACTGQDDSRAKENNSEVFAENSDLEQEQSEEIALSEANDLGATELKKEISTASDDEPTTEINDPTDRPAYELEDITENRYERNGSFIEFYDLPENDAETIVCYDLLYMIAGKENKIFEFLYRLHESEQIELEQLESLDETVGNTENSLYEWIKVNEVSTMSFDELTECDCYDKLFLPIRDKFRHDMEYDDYVKMILDNGCVVVSIKYSDKYTEEANSSGLQIADGEHEEYWLFVPDKNGQLRIFDYTRYYGGFVFYFEDDNAPEALLAG